MIKKIITQDKNETNNDNQLIIKIKMIITQDKNNASNNNKDNNNDEKMTI